MLCVLASGILNIADASMSRYRPPIPDVNLRLSSAVSISFISTVDDSSVGHVLIIEHSSYSVSDLPGAQLPLDDGDLISNSPRMRFLLQIGLQVRLNIFVPKPHVTEHFEEVHSLHSVHG